MDLDLKLTERGKEIVKKAIFDRLQFIDCENSRVASNSIVTDELALPSGEFKPQVKVEKVEKVNLSEPHEDPHPPHFVDCEIPHIESKVSVNDMYSHTSNATIFSEESNYTVEVKSEIVENSESHSDEDPLNLVNCVDFNDLDDSTKSDVKPYLACGDSLFHAESLQLKHHLKAKLHKCVLLKYDVIKACSKINEIKTERKKVKTSTSVEDSCQSLIKSEGNLSPSSVHDCGNLPEHTPEEFSERIFIELPEHIPAERYPSNSPLSLAVRKPWKCEICYKRFAASCCLEAHKTIHTSDNLFACEFCDKTFVRKYNYDVHRNNHTGDRKYSCSICKKSFKQRSSLKVHSFTHLAHKRFKCEICDKLFAQSGNLKSHMLTHSGKRNFKCDVCDKSFFQPQLLKGHMVIHTGEKRFCCDICGKLFYQKSHLKMHMEIHIGEKNFKCHLCDKAFHRRPGLKSHMLSHTGEKRFKCQVCDKRFSMHSNLKNHMFIHTGEKRYKCEICDRTFSHSSNYAKHKTTHSGEKKHVCSVCGKGFSRRNTMRAHTAIHFRK